MLTIGLQFGEEVMDIKCSTVADLGKGIYSIFTFGWFTFPLLSSAICEKQVTCIWSLVLVILGSKTQLYFDEDLIPNARELQLTNLLHSWRFLSERF